MKLLHHSQGYSQCTFIQKGRSSQVNHSGQGELHWSEWATNEKVGAGGQGLGESRRFGSVGMEE